MDQPGAKTSNSQKNSHIKPHGYAMMEIPNRKVNTENA